MSRHNETDRALQFALSTRGQLIIGQALCVAIKEMEKIPHPRKEASNIADMQYLLDELFAIGKVTQIDHREE